MAVKIKLKRIGKKRNPQYRIVIADARTARGGRSIEEIGVYQPRQEPSLIRVDSDRAQYWLGVGAQPTEAVAAILKVTGDWQKFKGLPGAEGTLRVAEPKPDKQLVFEAAVRSAEGAGKEAKAAKAAEAKAARAEKAAEVKAEVKAELTELATEVKVALAEVAAEVTEKLAEKAAEHAEKAAERAEKAAEMAQDASEKAAAVKADAGSEAPSA